MKALSKIVTILLLLILIFFVYKLIENKQPEIIIKTDTIFSKKTITEIIPDTIIKTKDIEKIIYINDTIINWDTVYLIVEDYFNTKFYIDTIFNDPTGILILSDSITENKIKSRQIVRNNIITEKYIQPKGFYFGGGFNTYSDVHIGASYLKNKSIFTIETGTQLMPDNNRGLFVEFDYKRKIFN